MAETSGHHSNPAIVRLLLLSPTGQAGTGRRNLDPVFKAMPLQLGKGRLREPGEQSKFIFTHPSRPKGKQLHVGVNQGL